MRAIIQRVTNASVTIDGKLYNKIDKGLLILLGVSNEDTPNESTYLSEKCCGLRIFSDENDKMNLSVKDIEGAFLVISNFTLYGNCKKGKRPNFMDAARPELAEDLYNQFVENCIDNGVPTVTGIFGADMKVELLNDGPVTIFMDTDMMNS